MSKISDYIEKRSKKYPDFREAIQQDIDELINQLPTGDRKDSVDDEAVLNGAMTEKEYHEYDYE